MWVGFADCPFPNMHYRIDKTKFARQAEMHSRHLWMKGHTVLALRLYNASSLRTWVVQNWPPSVKNVAQVLTMRLVVDTLPRDVNTTWGLSYIQSNGDFAIPVTGSTAWTVPAPSWRRPACSVAGDQSKRDRLGGGAVAGVHSKCERQGGSLAGGRGDSHLPSPRCTYVGSAALLAAGKPPRMTA